MIIYPPTVVTRTSNPPELHVDGVAAYRYNKTGRLESRWLNKGYSEFHEHTGYGPTTVVQGYGRPSAEENATLRMAWHKWMKEQGL